MPAVICISTSPWGFMFQRPQQLMTLFSEDFKIGYINPPVTSKPALSYEEVIRKYTDIINPNLIVLKPRIPKILNHSAASRYYVELLKNFSLEFGFKDIILWICLPQFEYLCGQLDEKLVIYDCQDDYASFSWTPDTTREYDQRLTEKADIVITVSGPMQKTKKKINPLSFLVPNGCDLQHFNSATKILGIPTDILNIRKPRVGFVGAVCEWIDFRLITELAEKEPDWSIVMVGPVRRNIKPPHLPNTHYLGLKRYHILPNYIRQFDVCSIPFDQNSTISKNSCPIKLFEYMASGKPVVSTNLPAVNFAKRVIEIAADSEDFHCKVNRLLKETSFDAAQRQAKQISLARANTWWTRYKTIGYIMNKYF